MNPTLKQKIKNKITHMLIESYDAECNIEDQFLLDYTVDLSDIWDTVIDNVREPVADVIDDIDLYHNIHYRNKLSYILPIPINIKSSVLKSLKY